MAPPALPSQQRRDDKNVQPQPPGPGVYPEVDLPGAAGAASVHGSTAAPAELGRRQPIQGAATTCELWIY